MDEVKQSGRLAVRSADEVRRQEIAQGFQGQDGKGQEVQGEEI
jgi:hypothetical protein